MALNTIMLIRHAEKPSDDGAIRGVAPVGEENQNELSVRGWQRAGALVPFLAPVDSHARIPRPEHLFAPGTTAELPSVRGRSTLLPLSEWLGLPVSTDFHKGQEEALSRAVQVLSGPVLIAWEHHALPALARHLAGALATIPDAWPDERFDMLWLITRQDTEQWELQQVPMLLLAGDSAERF